MELSTDSRNRQAGRPDFRKPDSRIKGPKESRNHAAKIRGTRTHVRGNKRFKEDGRSWDRGGDRFQEPESMIKGAKDSRNQTISGNGGTDSRNQTSCLREQKTS